MQVGQKYKFTSNLTAQHVKIPVTKSRAGKFLKKKSAGTQL